MKATYLNFKEWCEFHYNGIADFVQRVCLSSALILALITAGSIITSCSTSKTSLNELRAEISWSAFCEARGYDLNDNTYLTTNEYLDTWCGSVEEEAAFIKAGVEPY